MSWLLKLRKEKKLTQLQIANSCHITQQHYSYIETGICHPSVDVAKRIADALDFDWTLFYEDNAS